MSQYKSKQLKISPIKKLLFGQIFFCLILLLIKFLLGFAGLEKYDREFMPKCSNPIFVTGKGDIFCDKLPFQWLSQPVVFCVINQKIKYEYLL